MPEFRLIFQLLCAVVQCLTGVCANGIIVVANGVYLVRQRRLAPLDLLLSCLATTRICTQLFLFLMHLVTHSMVKHSIFTHNWVVFMFSNELGIWLATWLGVFYCAKISTIPHPLFFWLKMRISKLVPWLVLGSVVQASVISALHSKYTWQASKDILTEFFSKNKTKFIIMQNAPLPFFMAEHILPSLIFLIAVLLLVFSLGRHTQQMRTIVVSGREPCRNPHTNALFSILSFLILYISHYGMSVLICSQIFQVESSPFRFCMMVAGSYPAGHSVILILGHPKLKQNVKMFFLHGKCC